MCREGHEYNTRVYVTSDALYGTCVVGEIGETRVFISAGRCLVQFQPSGGIALDEANVVA